MNEDQLDLFRSAPAKPGAAIIVFPLWRREKTIRTVAHTLFSRKTDEGKKSYWVRIIRGLKDELRSRGCDQTEVDRQVGAFRSGIEAELARLRDGDRRSPGRSGKP